MFRERPGFFFLTLVILLLMPRAVMAQNEGGIRGVITDKEFDVPLGNALVWITETDAKMETGPEGQFVFHGLNPEPIPSLSGRTDIPVS